MPTFKVFHNGVVVNELVGANQGGLQVSLEVLTPWAQLNNIGVETDR